MTVTKPVTLTESSLTAGGAASAQAFPADAGRLYLGIFNNHATQDLWIRFGTGAAAVGLGIKLAAGASKEWGTASNPVVPGDAVQVIGSGAGTTAYMVSGTAAKHA